MRKLVCSFFCGVTIATCSTGLATDEEVLNGMVVPAEVVPVEVVPVEVVPVEVGGADFATSAQDDKNLVVESDVRVLTSTGTEPEVMKPAGQSEFVDKDEVQADLAWPVQVGDQNCEGVAQFRNEVVGLMEDVVQQDMSDDFTSSEVRRLFKITCQIFDKLRHEDQSNEQLEQLKVLAKVLLNAAAELGKLEGSQLGIFGETSSDAGDVTKQRIAASGLRRIYQAAPTLTPGPKPKADVEGANKREADSAVVLTQSRTEDRIAQVDVKQQSTKPQRSIFHQK